MFNSRSIVMVVVHFILQPIPHHGNKFQESHTTLVCSDTFNSTLSDSTDFYTFRETYKQLRKRDTQGVFPATKFLDELLGERIFNTTMNFIVPGAHVFLPKHTEEGSVDHLALQAFFGLVSAISFISITAIPVMVTYFQPLGIVRSFPTVNMDGTDNGINGFRFKWTMNEKVMDAIGLNLTNCLGKTICQANQNPKKYGALGTFIRFMVPFMDGFARKYDSEYQSNYYRKAESGGSDGHDCVLGSVQPISSKSKWKLKVLKFQKV